MPSKGTPPMRKTMLFSSAAALCLAACAGRPLPKYQKPIARAGIQRVRTTAYTHTEADHLKHGARSARGTLLQSGAVNSAAADWSRWPAGTPWPGTGRRPGSCSPAATPS